ncbi:ATP-binding protein [Methylotenera sp. L2L1]|uniref:ATP-binding protein n=1 Tax=Methylotenera sp. L2L1 TaxID=1502770 RepID=UPI000559CBCA|nr:ATP-binding protein [Methylotenera sp. L2L1]
MNHSIKRFLLIYITLAILLIYCLISLASYWVSKEELDELYDANLEQVGSAIAAQHLAIHDVTHLYSNTQVGKGSTIQGEEEFYVRVLAKDGTVLYVSHPDIKVPLPSTLGFSTQKYLNKQWRFFAIKVNQETIQVAQSLRLRKNTIKETAISLMASQLLFIPFLVLLIFLAIRKALSPLSILSYEIQHRHSTDLKPFPDHQLPVEIKPLVQSLNIFMGKLSDMVGVLKRFTSDAAHELRTPITALKLQLSLLEQAKTKDEQELAIQSLKIGVGRTEQLISQLLTLARIEPNNRLREIQRLNLLQLVKESIEELLPLAHQKGIDLGLTNGEVAMIDGVQHEIKVLINNILDNAIRYTPNYGSVNISLSNDTEHAVLEVNDTGPGISNDDFERVFERFYRGENKDTCGSGLGLSIVREIALQHGAIIKLSNLNHGLSFKVTFVR